MASAGPTAFCTRVQQALNRKASLFGRQASTLQRKQDDDLLKKEEEMKRSATCSTFDDGLSEKSSLRSTTDEHDQLQGLSSSSTSSQESSGVRRSSSSSASSEAPDVMILNESSSSGGPRMRMKKFMWEKSDDNPFFRANYRGSLIMKAEGRGSRSDRASLFGNYFYSDHGGIKNKTSASLYPAQQHEDNFGQKKSKTCPTSGTKTYSFFLENLKMDCHMFCPIAIAQEAQSIWKDMNKRQDERSRFAMQLQDRNSSLAI